MGARKRSTGFAFVHDDVVAAAVAPNPQKTDLVLRVLGQLHGFVSGLDGMTVETPLIYVASIMFSFIPIRAPRP